MIAFKAYRYSQSLGAAQQLCATKVVAGSGTPLPARGTGCSRAIRDLPAHPEILWLIIAVLVSAVIDVEHEVSSSVIHGGLMGHEFETSVRCVQRQR